MVMDQSFGGLKLGDEAFLGISDGDLVNGFGLASSFVHPNYIDIPPPRPDPDPSSTLTDSSEDFDFSDVVLKYISDMLMEEDMEEKTCMFHESSALQAAEKSFYDVLGETYPPHANMGNGRRRSCDVGKSVQSQSQSQSNSQSLSNSSTSYSYTMEGFVDSPVSTLSLPEIFSDCNSVVQFNRGVEEASKFLPNGGRLIVGLESHGFSFEEMKEEARNVELKVEKNSKGLRNEEMKEEARNVELKVEKKNSKGLRNGSRGKKKSHSEDEDKGHESGRSNKQSAVYSESTVSSDMFDMVLLNCHSEDALREALQSGTNKKGQEQDGGPKGKSRGKKKKKGKKDVIDLRTFLTLCAQAVAVDDRRNASDLLKQIRLHSSSTGDGMQRMAHCFANGLEARLAGSGTQVYKDLITKPTSAADVLKAYHLFLAACPFRKLSNFFSNKTIMNLAENVSSIHIIDFGILYGFQWPCLIQRLSTRQGGPPKIRITGVDFPQPGFKPAERVEETGHRLAKYAEKFNVPFEFNAIAQKWDSIQMEDFKIDRGELLVVNCLYRFRNLLDETVVVKSPRDGVMNLIREMNPNVIIEGIVNGAHSAPFFITRFREALFFYSSVFDMLETNIPRDDPERMLLETSIFGKEAMNVIACEGSERIERPETYKQWHLRNTRAGLRPLPLDREMVGMAKDRVHSYYHKDFVIDEDGPWLLQGWKGRILYALSTWIASTS